MEDETGESFQVVRHTDGKPYVRVYVVVCVVTSPSTSHSPSASLAVGILRTLHAKHALKLTTYAPVSKQFDSRLGRTSDKQ